MYKMLVVDDEKRIREGMADVIAAGGEFETRTAGSGREALALLEAECADAMLLDIAMPDMDGLELLRTLSSRGIAPLTIIISSYEEFEYAREAMCCGAIDYVLKPVDADDLSQICGRLIALIDKQNAQRRREEQLQIYVQEHLQEIRQKLLTDILDGHIRQNMLEDIRLTYGIELRGDYSCAAIILMRRATADVHEMDFQVALRRFEVLLNERLKQALDFNVNVFSMENGRYVLLMNGFQALPMAKVDALLDELIDSCAHFPEIRAYIGKGEQANAYEQLATSYAQACEALDYRSIFGHGVVYDIRDYQKNPKLTSTALLLDEMEEALRLGSYDRVEKQINALFDSLRENLHEFTSAQLRYFILRCRVLLPTQLIRNGIDYSESMLTENLRMWGTITERDLRRARANTLEMLGVIRQSLSEETRTHQEELAAKLCRYLDAHSAENDMGVNALSRKFGYSANYLGNIFKKLYSVSVSDYLNQCRVTQAKYLMDETPLRIYEIAFRVGFSDQNYFSKIFKKYSGVSPTEYRERSF